MIKPVVAGPTRPSAVQQRYMDDQIGALISFNMITFTGASEASCPGGNPDMQSCLSLTFHCLFRCRAPEVPRCRGFPSMRAVESGMIE